MSDRIAVMSDGRVAQCGPPEEVYEHPKEEFVAGFIGISNLLEGRVETGGRVRIGEDRLEVPDLGDGRGTGETVQIAVRPGRSRSTRSGSSPTGSNPKCSRSKARSKARSTSGSATSSP